MFASTNILSSWHDAILSKAATAKLPPSQRPKPSAHARYTAHHKDTSKLYSFAAKTLTLLKHTELLLEMVAYKKLSRSAKWRVIVIIEMIKCVVFLCDSPIDVARLTPYMHRAMLRISLFRSTSSRPTIDPPLPERELDPAIFAQLDSSDQHSLTPSSSSSASWTGKRTGRIYPSLSSLSSPSQAGAARFPSSGQPRAPTNAAVRSLITHNAKSVQDLTAPDNLLAPLNGSGEQWNELIYILRPLIYGEHSHSSLA